eukprot:CAMPEP_0184312768 /NCGR_PEP_ID=MMETSP1049-20130417/53625_1 /TAXON_ID=77928 /ORGANISM="Proteomonas sulcata, Strain CCMP704" /LENGTH=83 /DNA_ID=CAMNT_0026629249 /DNA_START=36 /DNA_END=287 /DNA_ORIENTATION=-
MPVDNVIQRVAGPPGTLVLLQFKHKDSHEHYNVAAMRHVPLGAQARAAVTLSPDIQTYPSAPSSQPGDSAPAPSPPLSTGRVS